MNRLARLGGIFLHPSRTFDALLRGEGSVFDVLPWALLTSVTVAPSEAGQALLLLRMDLVDGATALIGLFANRFGWPLAGAAIAALLLSALERAKHQEGHGFDRLFDATAYALLPHLLLASAGGALSSVGAELWFMPHRLLRGRWDVLTLRIAVAFGWSLVLTGLLARKLWRGTATT